MDWLNESGSLRVCLRRAPPGTPSRGPARTTALPRTCTRSSLTECVRVRVRRLGGPASAPAATPAPLSDGRTPLALNATIKPTRSREHQRAFCPRWNKPSLVHIFLYGPSAIFSSRSRMGFGFSNFTELKTIFNLELKFPSDFWIHLCVWMTAILITSKLLKKFY